jgi:hypothetical protein
MSKQVSITFTFVDYAAAKFMLEDIVEGKPYAATVYGPDESDDRGNPGCGLDYYVFTDDSGARVGYAKAPYDNTAFSVTE